MCVTHLREGPGQFLSFPSLISQRLWQYFVNSHEIPMISQISHGKINRLPVVGYFPSQKTIKSVRFANRVGDEIIQKRVKLSTPRLAKTHIQLIENICRKFLTSRQGSRPWNEKKAPVDTISHKYPKLNNLLTTKLMVSTTIRSFLIRGDFLGGLPYIRGLVQSI